MIGGFREFATSRMSMLPLNTVRGLRQWENAHWSIVGIEPYLFRLENKMSPLMLIDMLKNTLCSAGPKFTYIAGIKLLMFIWARISHVQNRFWPLSPLGHGIFSSRRSFETEHRKVHSNYVREHRRSGLSIFLVDYRFFFQHVICDTRSCMFPRTAGR